MRINERLQMTIPLYRDDVIYAWVHSAPVSREVFEANYSLLARTYTATLQEGAMGPRMATLAMRTVAQRLGSEDMPDVSAALLNEIRRLTNILLPTARGWDTVPLHEAMERKMIDADDVSEVMAAVTFFTVAWHVHPRMLRKDFLERAASLWGAQMSSANCTEFSASLPTSTVTASSGETAPPGTVLMTAPDGTTRASSLPV